MLQVFILFSDGSVYILCPVVPFGRLVAIISCFLRFFLYWKSTGLCYLCYYSVYKWESVLEIYNDAQTFGLKASSSKAVSNANLAISWLEATFPDLAEQAAEGGNQPALKSHPYALFDASVSLQVFLLTAVHSRFHHYINLATEQSENTGASS